MHALQKKKEKERTKERERKRECVRQSSHKKFRSTSEKSNYQIRITSGMNHIFPEEKKKKPVPNSGLVPFRRNGIGPTDVERGIVVSQKKKLPFRANALSAKLQTSIDINSMPNVSTHFSFAKRRSPSAKFSAQSSVRAFLFLFSISRVCRMLCNYEIEIKVTYNTSSRYLYFSLSLRSKKRAQTRCVSVCPCDECLPTQRSLLLR